MNTTGHVWKKTDTANMSNKVEIRKWLLSRLGIDEVYLLDTCAGKGDVWSACEEAGVVLRQWTRVDLKPRKDGTLKLDATTALSKLDLSTYNTIDIDTYGEPWEPYFTLLPKITKPTAVFLTRGALALNIPSIFAMGRVGIPKDWRKNMGAWGNVLHPYIDALLVSQTLRFCDVTHAAMVDRAGGMRLSYYALGLKPKSKTA